jgi:YbbR domain-containing protein
MVYHPFHHLGLKFLSVCVALGLWFTVAGERTVERMLTVPLEWSNTPEQLVLVESPPGTVEVRVRGTQGRLSQLPEGAVVAMLDLLPLAKEGVRYAHLLPDQVRAPAGVEVVEVQPGNVPLKFEKLMSKSVPVVPLIEGEPAPGYLAGEATVEPATVQVSGPESTVKRLTRATTEVVSVSGQRLDVREVVRIGLSESNLRVPSPGTVTVTVPIQPRTVERLFTAVPVRVRGAGPRLSVRLVPAVVAVAVRGPSGVVEALRPDQVTAFVDLAGLGPGRYNRSVQVDPAQDVVAVRTEPAAVQVTIR